MPKDLQRAHYSACLESSKQVIKTMKTASQTSIVKPESKVFRVHIKVQIFGLEFYTEVHADNEYAAQKAGLRYLDKQAEVVRVERI